MFFDAASVVRLCLSYAFLERVRQILLKNFGKMNIFLMAAYIYNAE